MKVHDVGLDVTQGKSEGKGHDHGEAALVCEDAHLVGGQFLGELPGTLEAEDMRPMACTTGVADKIRHDSLEPTFMKIQHHVDDPQEVLQAGRQNEVGNGFRYRRDDVSDPSIQLNHLW
jgi:hypothetical protein